MSRFGPVVRSSAGSLCRLSRQIKAQFRFGSRSLQRLWFTDTEYFVSLPSTIHGTLKWPKPTAAHLNAESEDSITLGMNITSQSSLDFGPRQYLQRRFGVKQVELKVHIGGPL